MSSPPEDSSLPPLRRGGSLGMAEAFGSKPNNDGATVLPDRPEMRAMAIMNQGPSLISAGPLAGGSFGISKPPPLGISRPSHGLVRPKSEGAGGVGLKQEIFAMAPSSVWDVKHDELDDVPEFCLERTHRVIPDTTAAIVAQRISDVLRVNSIDAEYDCKAAKAKCKTCDYVCFRIRLYAGDDSLQPRPVVVEVQRRSGSASSFMRTCRAILNAAEGKSPALEPKRAVGPPPALGSSRRGMLPPPLKPVGQMSFMKSMPPALKPNHVEGESSDSLDKAREMIRSDQRDINILGMENLAALTDPIKTNPLVAMKVSKCLIWGQDGHDMREEIRLLTEHDVFASDAEEGMKHHSDQLRSISLSVFSNALELCQKNGCLSTMTTDKWFQDSLLPTLVDQVNRSESNANDSYEAACCIHSLLMACPSTVPQSVRGSGGVEALQQANEFGNQRHELLANETRRCLKLLNA